jgi:hypothetical protein
MIVFADIQKAVRVFRSETDAEGHLVRTLLGRIPKATFEIDANLAAQLQPSELTEVEAIVAGYLEAETQRKRSYAMALPVILREVMEHLETDATEIEKTFVFGALVEAMRRMRRFQRE